MYMHTHILYYIKLYYVIYIYAYISLNNKIGEPHSQCTCDRKVIGLFLYFLLKKKQVSPPVNVTSDRKVSPAAVGGSGGETLK